MNKCFMIMLISLTFFSCATKDSEETLIVTAGSKKIDTVLYGSTIFKKLRIENNSDDSVSVIRIVTSCGCMAIRSAFPRKIAPKSIISVEILFTPEKKDSGFVKKIVLIYTDGAQKLFELPLSFFVES